MILLVNNLFLFRQGSNVVCLFVCLQRKLCSYVGKSLVENVLPILLVAFHCDLTQLLDQCIERVARSDLDRFCIEKELPFEVSEKIKQLRVKSVNIPEEVDKSLERTGKVLKALDSDDVELVKLLLTESDITLDQANGLHYAVAYSDPKVVTQVLDLNMADVNFRNSRGYTVLHIAAMRREPTIIIPLIQKGAHASDFTFDGRSAVNICRRLTRPKDYHSKTSRKEPSKDRLCIDILEREIRRNPLVSGDTPTCSHSMPEDLQMRLLYLEKRGIDPLDIISHSLRLMTLSKILDFSCMCYCSGSCSVVLPSRS